jgi:hypothetical protein
MMSSAQRRAARPDEVRVGCVWLLGYRSLVIRSSRDLGKCLLKGIGHRALLPRPGHAAIQTVAP